MMYRSKSRRLHNVHEELLGPLLGGLLGGLLVELHLDLLVELQLGFFVHNLLFQILTLPAIELGARSLTSLSLSNQAMDIVVILIIKALTKKLHSVTRSTYPDYYLRAATN